MKNYDEIARDVFRRRDEYESKKRHKQAVLRRVGNVMAALFIAITIVFTAGTCYVLADYFGIGDWFKEYFQDHSESALSTQQQEYIDENAVDIGQSMTCNGVTVTARSAMTDGSVAYILLDIEAPENVDLNALNGHGLGFTHSMKSTNPNKHLISGSSSGFIPQDDGDGRNNTISMLLRINVSITHGSRFTFADGYTRYLYLEDLSAYQEEYPFTQYTIAEGKWAFSLTFSEAVENSVEEMEILSAPIITTGTRLSGADFEMIVTSIKMRGLSAICFYTFADGVRGESSDFGPFQIVMKDGSIVTANPRGGSIYGPAGSGIYTEGYFAYLFDAPVIFDEIDHLLLQDGQIIPMPQNIVSP